MDSRDSLIKDAVSLLEVYPQVSYGGATVQVTSAERFYYIILRSAMENFVYGFGIYKFVLNNPTRDTDNRDYILFNLPPNVGRIFIVCDVGYLPYIRDVMMLRGSRTLGGYGFTKVKGNRLQLHWPGEFNTPLSLGYITLDPEVSDMSESFKSFVRYMIAYQLALVYLQQKNVHQLLHREAIMHKHNAQKYSLENTSLFEYNHASLATSPLTTNRLGETIKPDKNLANFKYHRGV